jgi:hypothetical protein
MMHLSDDNYILTLETIGGKLKKERISEETPRPAHVL